MKNINGDLVFSLQLVNVKVVFSLEYEKIGRGYNKLEKHKDYEVFRDDTTLFIKMTKKFECGEEHHLKIKVLGPDEKIVDLLTLFKPKGWILKSILQYNN